MPRPRTKRAAPRSGARTHLLEARSCLGRGDVHGAVAALEAALRADRRSVPAHQALGRLYLDLAEYARAHEVLRRAIELAPEDSSSQASFGALLMATGRHDAALTHFERAIELSPERAHLYSDLGECQILQGALDQAERTFERLGELDPGDLSASIGLAAVAERRGELEEALERLDPLVQAGHRSSAVLTTWGRACRRVGRAAEAAELLGATLPLARTPESKAKIGCVLGECLDRLGMHDEAFEAYAAANDARPLDYDPRGHRREVEAMIGAFDGPSFRRRARSAAFEGSLTREGSLAREGQPLFIVGMPRSGTSLLEQILSAHPSIYGAGELELIWDLSRLLPKLLDSEQRFPECMDELSPEIAEESADWYRREVRRLFPSSAGAEYVTDKLPQNYLYLGLIAHLFPNAQIIHCERDPLDTCLSCYVQDFGNRQAFSRRLEWLGARYRDYQRIISHWEEVLPLPIHRVRYEALASDPEPVIRGLLTSLGLPWDDRCLHPEANPRVVATASYAQVKEPIHRGRVGRAARYAAHLDPLRASLGHLS
ncbi:MAG: sulfotransferase [Myxococcales bacterium]|nr:sulfotransferase [Myxococcales bacterium]